MSESKKILIISAHAPSLVNFRGHLITMLKENGYAIYASAPDLENNSKVISWFAANKYTLLENYLNNTKIGFFSEIRSFWHLFCSIKKTCPDLILAYGLKPVIYGSLCGFLSGVKKSFSIITGLGHFFMDENINKRSSRLVQLLYKVALKTNKKVFFQNQDDLDLFIRKKLISAKKSVLINGSGVDTDHFNYCGPSIDPLRFTFVGRLIKQKGVMEFYQAAKAVKRKHPNVIFTIVGGLYPNPSVLNEQEFRQITQDPDIEYLREITDVREILRKTSVFVLPSYREGTSRATLEAMSMGLPIITTDAPGCQQLVKNGENGYLVRPRYPQDLEKAFLRIILEKKNLTQMGKISNTEVKKKFLVKKINKTILDNLC